jgi:hypothetical protein
MKDKIQERCIDRAGELDLNPRQIWLAIGGANAPVSYAHIQAYLTRRKSMGSHKLQHLLPPLGLALASIK